ncbi:MAG: 5-formyltetrahydrofolate cyclo-ligase [Clostridia bacterium]|nr:5-formyltetrahydrofolate cyclo-ligase [Clostridia bacterium]
MNDIRILKNELRAEYRQKRQEMSPEEKNELDMKITQRFLSSMSYKHATQILLYASTDEEISTKIIFETALKDGKKCFFPRCFEHSQMDYYRADSEEELIEDKFNIKAPLETAEKYTPHPSDICIVPAMAYDKKGFRLGYGKGFYDRFLPGFLGIKTGFCYSDFIKNQLPRGRYDISVDMIITEKGVILL